MQSATARKVEDGARLLEARGLRLEGRFEISGRLCLGSYSELFLARNLIRGIGQPAEVVVKALNPWVRGDVEPDLERTLFQNFTLEAQSLLGFDHPNIAPLFGCGTSADFTGRQFHYLVLEYMPGGSMANYCRRQPLSYEQTLYYTGQISGALSYAHGQGPNCVLHRDVKPGNIMLSSDGRTAKLIDFGTARRLGSGSSVTQVGTDVYAAPEHYSQSCVAGGDLTPAADVYGLAKTVYYMLCGESPSQFAQRPITSLPGEIASQVWAPAVLQVLRRATSDSPPARHQSVREFYEDLCAASELTAHSPRGGEDDPRVRARRASRVVITVEQESPRDYLAEAISAGSACLRRAAHVPSKACEICRALGTRSAPLLRAVGRAVAACCRHAWPLLDSLRRRFNKRAAAAVLSSVLLLVVASAFLRYRALRDSGKAQGQDQLDQATGGLATASTDINVRSGPGVKSQKIGLVERGSRVRILAYSQDKKWCDVEIVQHGREKENPASADRGWVRRRLLAEAR